MFKFTLMDRYKRQTYDAIRDLHKDRKKILDNDQLSGSFKEKQLEEAEEEQAEKVEKNVEKYEEKFNEELEDTKLAWETTEERKAELPAVQERLRGIEDPNKLGETMEEILTSDEPEAFQQVAYRLVSNRLKALDASSWLHEVQELRKKHLLTDEEVQRLRVVQAAEGVEDMVRGFKNGTNQIFGTVKSGNYDDQSGEELQSRLEGSVAPFHDKLKEKINAAKNSN